MLKSLVANPFTQKELIEGSRTHKRVKYLQSLHKLNTTKTKIPNPSKKGKPILVFGHSHINYIYNNFSLNQQNGIIEKLKKQLVNDKTKKRMEEGIHAMKDRDESLRSSASKDLTKIKHTLEMTELKRLEKEVEDEKRKIVEAKKQMAKIQQKITKLKERKEEKEGKEQFSCLALLYEKLEEDEVHEFKKTDIVTGPGELKYRKIFAGYANVRGNILPYNNKRTYKLHDFGNFSRLKAILKTDDNMEALIRAIEISRSIDLIIIKGVTRTPNVKKPHNPLKHKLFTESTSNAIHHKNISYDINKEAKSFGGLFKIKLHQYTQDNFKANSCYVNLIVNTWHGSFEIRDSTGVRIHAPLTYESVCEIIGLTYQHQDIGLSIHQSVKFFEKFRLGLDVLNQFGEMIFSYRPARLNTHICPQVLRVLVHNSHIYNFDKVAKSKIDKLRAKYVINETQKNEVNSLHVSDKYILRKPVLDKFEIHFVNTLDDCMHVVKTMEGQSKVRFVTETSLLDLLFEMLKERYTPTVGFSGSRIMSLSFSVGKINAIIETPDNTAPDDRIIYIGTKELYEAYHKADDNFYGKILNDQLKSEYSDSVLDVEEKYPMGPLTGYLTKKFRENKTYNAIDTVKAYSSCLQMINHVPVFGYFDIYKKYDNHEIEDYTMYCVEVNASDIRTSILFPEIYSRCFGFHIKFAQANQIDVGIHHFRRPYKLEPVNYKSAIDELYANDTLKNEHKKHIVNKTTGLAEKKYNSAHICKIFQDYAEAQHHLMNFGGKIYSLQQTDFIYDDSIQGMHLKDLSDEDFLNRGHVVNHGPLVHVLVIEKKQRLVNGFRYIKELIYNHMAIKMFDLFTEVVSKGIKPKGIKTDAILVSESKEQLEKLFSFNPSQVGGIKFEKDKCCANKRITQHSNKPFDIKQLETYEHIIQDEWDSNEFRNLFDAMDEWDNRLLIKGENPGVGKSTCVINYKKHGHKILVVPPFNELAKQTRMKGVNSITINTLLGFFGEGQQYVKMKPYDITKYDCICFDEIMMNPPSILQKIALFMNSHPEKKFFSTGDLDQLQPINFVTDIKDPRAYLMDCINQMFPNQVTLKIIKRVKTEEERKRITDIKKEIFDPTKDVMTILKKYNFETINQLSQLESTNNICYFNFRRKMINTYVHENLVDQPKRKVTIKDVNYWVGLKLICKEHYQSKNDRLFKNYPYTIKKIDTNNFIVHEPVEDKTLKFPIKMLSHFTLPYANTCYSVQGVSIDDSITIFDANTPYVDRFFVWTALTRATNLAKVKFFEHSQSDIEKLTTWKKKQYFKLKIKGYQRQDKIAGREWTPDDYITIDWIEEEYDKVAAHCCVCSAPYETNVVDGRVHSNLTVDRLDNSKPHVKDNSRLLCVGCNVKRSNHY